MNFLKRAISTVIYRLYRAMVAANVIIWGTLVLVIILTVLGII